MVAYAWNSKLQGVGTEGSVRVGEGWHMCIEKYIHSYPGRSWRKVLGVSHYCSSSYFLRQGPSTKLKLVILARLTCLSLVPSAGVIGSYLPVSGPQCWGYSHTYSSFICVLGFELWSSCFHIKCSCPLSIRNLRLAPATQWIRSKSEPHEIERDGCQTFTK